MIAAKLSGRHEIEIWGDGEQTRSFMFIEDCLKGSFDIMRSEIGYPINLGSDQLISINQLVDLVEEIAGIKLRRTYNRNAPQGVRGRKSDNTLIKKELQWAPDTPLRDGMRATYDWIYAQMAGSPNRHGAALAAGRPVETVRQPGAPARHGCRCRDKLNTPTRVPSAVMGHRGIALSGHAPKGNGTARPGLVT